MQTMLKADFNQPVVFSFSIVTFIFFSINIVSRNGHDPLRSNHDWLMGPLCLKNLEWNKMFSVAISSLKGRASAIEISALKAHRNLRLLIEEIHLFSNEITF